MELVLRDNRISLKRVLAHLAVSTCFLASAYPVSALASNATGNDGAIQVSKVVKTVKPEKAVATVSKTKVKHVSPTSNVLTILKNVPGFNVLSSGPGNLLTGDTAFTLDGFTSAEVGSTFDGVPIINTFLGGIYGQGETHAITPLTTGQISSVQVFSGANTPQQNSIDSLGGTINFVPKMPSRKSGVDLSVGGGTYKGYGSMNSYGVTANTGAIKSLNGFRALARFEHTNTTGFQKYVYGHLNSYYLSAVQPFDQGLSKLSFIFTHNDQTSRMPEKIPLPLIQRFGRDYQYPGNVANNWVKTQATHAILGLKTLLNPYTVGSFKFFYNRGNNDRTAYANPIYNNSYLGYGLPTHLKSASALDGYGNNFNAYNSTLATQLFGSAHAGTQYQRYVANNYNLGAKSHLTFMLPNNTVTVGAMVMHAKMLSQEGWYGSKPVPIQTGYNNAWVEHDGRDQYDAYIQDDSSWLNGRLHVYPGVKYAHVSMFSNDDPGYYYYYGGSQSANFEYFEPSLGATFSASKAVELYANYGRTYKSPNISAIYSLIGSNPQPAPVTVKPEYVDSFDVGVRFSNAFGKFSASVFDRRFQHIFSYSYSNVTGVTTEYNSGTADYKGFKLGAEKPLFDDFVLQGNFGYTSAKYTKSFTGDNGSVSSGMWRPDVPEYTGNLGLDYSRGGWFGSVSAHFVGPQYIAYNSGVTSSTRIPAYSTVDLKGSYTWKLSGHALKKIKLSAYVDNLFNTNYIAAAYIQGSAGASGNYQMVQEGAPIFGGISLKASF